MAEKTKIDILIETAEAAKSVKELKTALKGLKDAQQDVDKSSPDFQKLISGINNTEGAIGDLNDSFNTFAGSGVERLSASTGLLKDGFDNLDLDKVGIAFSSLKQLPKALAGEMGKLTEVVGKLNFKNLGSSMKDLGKSGVGELTKSIITLGKAILTNPILLLASVIIGLIAVFVKFHDKIKPIKEIVDAVGKAVDWLIQKFKDLADWMGLTDFAGEKMTKNMISNAEAQKGALTRRYDQEIAMASAAGKNTLKIEEEKVNAIMKTNNTQIAGLQDNISKGRESAEEDKKRIAELMIENEGFYNNLQVLRVKDAKDAADAKQKDADDEKKKLEDQAKKYADFLKERQAANKSLSDKIKDQEVSLIKDAEQRDQAKLALENQRAQESINISKASNEVKNAALIEQELVFQDSKKGIEDKYRLEKEAKEAEAVEAEKKRQEEIRANNEAMNAAALEDFNKWEAAKITAAEDGSIAEQEARLSQNESLKQQELEALNLTNEEKAIINATYKENEDKINEEYHQKEIARQTAKLDSINQLAQQQLTSAGNLADTVFEIQKANDVKGSESALKHAKQNFKIKKALSLTGAVVDTATGIMKSLASAPLAIGVVPNPVGIASMIAVASAGILNIAKIAGQQFTGGEGSATPPTAPNPSIGGGGAPSGGGPSAQFNAPSFYKLGQGGGADAGATNQRVYVVESDITNTQRRVSKVEARATQSL